MSGSTPMMQATLRAPLRFEGIGLHTGAKASVEFGPPRRIAG